jgi:large subunit ribosomal protein L25
MQKIKLAVKPREEKTPNQLRREGKIPATLYGPGQPSDNVQIDEREFIRLPAGAHSHMIELDFEGKGTNAVIRNIQRKATSSAILNIELYRVSMDRLLTMTVPLKFIGTAPAIAEGAQVIEVFQEADIESLPGDIPDYIEVDLSMLKEIDDSIHFGELTLPKGVKVLNPTDEVVARAVIPRAIEVEEPAAAATAAPAEGAAAEGAAAPAAATPAPNA